jgi:hypothetical protein
MNGSPLQNLNIRDMNSFGVGLWTSPGALGTSSPETVLREAFGVTLEGQAEAAPPLDGEAHGFPQGVVQAGRVIAGLRPHEMTELFEEATTRLAATLEPNQSALLGIWPPLRLLRNYNLAARGMFGGVVPQGHAVLRGGTLEAIPLHNFFAHLQAQAPPADMLLGQEAETVARAIGSAFLNAYQNGECPAWRSEQVAKRLEEGMRAAPASLPRTRL